MWVAASYLAVALVTFIALARRLEPLDGQAWVSIALIAMLWPAVALMLAFGR